MPTLPPASASFTVDCAATMGPLPKAWAHTGFMPATLLLKPAMRQAMQWYAAIPPGGLRHCRIHYLLDLLAVKGIEDGGEPIYDWSRFDEGIDLIVASGLAPFFELMGDPTGPRVEDDAVDTYGVGRHGKSQGWFTDFCKAEQYAAWRRIVADVARHCIARYGHEEVRSWYWETWNEPDVGWWKQGIDQLNAYTKACIEGLHDADPQLQFGGPGTCQTMSKELTAWLKHADDQNLPLAFISVHEKGASSHVENVAINTPLIVERTRRLIRHLKAEHPRLAALPFMNNECDPIVGWGRIHSYHAQPWHAAWALRVLDLHLRTIVDEDGMNLVNLGNDHGFLGSWGMRTLLTLIDLAPKNEAGMFPRHLGGADGRFLLVKKPIYNFHVIMSLLGSERLTSTCTGNDDCGILATSDEDSVAIAYYHHRDRSDHGGFSIPASLTINNLAPGQWRMVHERIDEEQDYPYAIFASGPCDPPEPATQRQYLNCGELRRAGPATDITGGSTLHIDLDVPLPGMGLVLLVRDPGQAPQQVCSLSAEHWPGISADEQVMLRWQHLPHKYLARYEVERESEGVWQRINPDTRCAAWSDLRTPCADGQRYRVRAVDLWDRHGPWSEIIRA